MTLETNGPMSAPTLDRASSINPAKDQKMNEKIDITALAETPATSRRKFLKTIAAACYAATLPAAAYAGGSANTLPPISRAEWSGPGLYLVECGHLKRTDVLFFITREWSETERSYLLWGGYYWDGNVCGPREVIDPDRVIRKLKGGAV